MFAKEGAPFNGQNPAQGDGISYESPSDEQIKDGNEAKERTIAESENNDSQQKPTTVNTDAPSSQPADSNELAVKITNATVEGRTLYIRTEIGGLYSTGSCTLVLQNGDRTVQKTSGIQAYAKISSCQGFNIPVSELGDGTWKITLTATVKDKKGIAVSSIKL